jgi:hypothetical protein
MPSVLGLTTDSKPSTSTNFSSPHPNQTMGNNRLDTISKRNHHAAVEIETLLWRALIDSPESAKEYLAKDCVMINPLFAPDGSDEPAGPETDMTIDDLLKGAQQWNSYKIHGKPLVVEVDLMAVAMVYKVTLYRQGKKGMQEVNCTASSSWRQTAGADWLLCAFHVAYAD